MPVSTIATPTDKLAKLGLSAIIHYQLSPEELAQDVLRRNEGVLNDTGALVIKTGEFTGRSPKDKFTVKDDITESTVNWNDFNIPLDPGYFDIIHKKIKGSPQQAS